MSPRQKNVPLWIHRDRVVVVGTLLSGTGDGGNDAAGVDLPQSGVRSICDVSVAFRVERHAAGLVERRVDGRAAVALRAIQPRAGTRTRNQMDRPIHGDLANAA